MRRMTPTNLHPEYNMKDGLEWVENRRRETTALHAIRSDETLGWTAVQGGQSEKKRTTIVTLMILPCITGGD